MRLGIDCREFQSPFQTGIGRILSGLIDWISEYRPDIVPVIFLNQRCKYEPVAPGAEIVVIPEKITLAWDQIHLPREIQRLKVDVFLSPYVKVPFTAGCPILMIVHDLIPILLPDDISATGKIKGAYFKLMLSGSMRKASRIISVSEYTKREIVRIMGAKPDSITVIHNGLREDLIPVKEPGAIQAAMSDVGLKRPYIFYLGHLRASKNVGDLIKAYSLLPPSLKKEYVLALGGCKSDEYPALEALVCKLGLERNVFFLGFVHDETVGALMAGAGVFVYPSKYEGFGYPPLEAMAMGAPVVCSTATSLGEIIGDAAIGVEPKPENIADGILKVLSDQNLRESLIRKGPIHAQNYSMENMSRKYVESFDLMMNRL